jgi:hypothetical protein
MFETICSIEADTSSTEPACSLAPWLISSELEESSWAPADTFSDACLTSPTTPVSFPIIVRTLSRI